MKRNTTKILCVTLVLTCLQLAIQAQDDRALRIGFQTSPFISWVSNNDNLIVKTSGNLGLKLGTTADIFFKDNYSFTMGINLAFHMGGEYLYEIGGSYLPKSDLSEPDVLQLGDKPMPDGTKIRYNLQYVEFPIGLKIKSKEIGYIRYFVEAPLFSFAFLTRGRGEIESASYDKTYDKENIFKDLNVFNVFWGLGAGIEYSISENNALVGGLYFQNGLLDFTKNNGHRAVDNPDVIPPYLLQKDDSKATVSNIMLRIGILF